MMAARCHFTCQTKPAQFRVPQHSAPWHSP